MSNPQDIRKALEEVEQWFERREAVAGDLGALDEQLEMAGLAGRVAGIRAALSQPPQAAQPVAWSDEVEQRILTWRARMMNVDGDRLAIDDFMDKESLDDLVDFVCAPLATPPTEPAPTIYADPKAPYQALTAGQRAIMDAIPLRGQPAPQAEPASLGSGYSYERRKSGEVAISHKDGGLHMANSCELAMIAEIERLRAEPAVCPECDGPLQWRCPACRIAQTEAVAEPAPQAEPADWREYAAKWLRRKAAESEAAANTTGWANPARNRPDALYRLAEELDAEQASAPYGSDAPIVNKFGDALRPEVQRFMTEATGHLIATHTEPAAALATQPAQPSAQGEASAEIQHWRDIAGHWEGRPCEGDCLSAPCSMCDGTRWIPGEGARLRGRLEEAKEELAAVASEPSAQGEAVAWKLVPVEPTEAMVKAMAKAWQAAVESEDPDECIAEYKAALASAPAAPAQAVPLTEEQVWRDDGIMSANAGAQLLMPCLMELIRAVERAHGIAPKAAQPN
jgi:hypothetical protein